MANLAPGAETGQSAHRQAGVARPLLDQRDPVEGSDDPPAHGGGQGRKVEGGQVFKGAEKLSQKRKRNGIRGRTVVK
jgi:hypothetical protein